jgi:hypothetical protein
MCAGRRYLLGEQAMLQGPSRTEIDGGELPGGTESFTTTSRRRNEPVTRAQTLLLGTTPRTPVEATNELPPPRPSRTESHNVGEHSGSAAAAAAARVLRVGWHPGVDFGRPLGRTWSSPPVGSAAAGCTAQSRPAFPRAPQSSPARGLGRPVLPRVGPGVLHDLIPHLLRVLLPVRNVSGPRRWVCHRCEGGEGFGAPLRAARAAYPGAGTGGRLRCPTRRGLRACCPPSSRANGLHYCGVLQRRRGDKPQEGSDEQRDVIAMSTGHRAVAAGHTGRRTARGSAECA